MNFKKKVIGAIVGAGFLATSAVATAVPASATVNATYNEVKVRCASDTGLTIRGKGNFTGTQVYSYVLPCNLAPTGNYRVQNSMTVPAGCRVYVYAWYKRTQALPTATYYSGTHNIFKPNNYYELDAVC